MADRMIIERVRQSLTFEESKRVTDDDIVKAAEFARLTGKENNPQFVISIIKSALRKGLGS